MDIKDIDVKHHFASGLYAKQVMIPAGIMLRQHVHKYDHLSMVLKGACRVTVDDESKIYSAGDILKIEAGREHYVEAITDVVWACVHATVETEADLVDAAVIA